jgi:hypothetical protein
VKTLVRLTDRGLPGPLPAGERLLWQGEPGWPGLALRAFHVREVALWFALLFLWRFVEVMQAGEGLAAAMRQASWAFVPAIIGLGLLAGLAWLYAKTTVYSITSRRLVIRSGIALPLTLNIPFRVIASAALRQHKDGSGDLPVKLMPGERIGYLFLWPNARPWRLRHPEPMLRALEKPEAAARLLSEALAAHAAEAGDRSTSSGNLPAAGAPQVSGPAGWPEAATAA